MKIKAGPVEVEVDKTEFKELYEILKSAYKSLKGSIAFSPKKRAEFREALSETCKLVQTVLALTIHRFVWVRELAHSRKHMLPGALRELPVKEKWEKHLRDVCLCDPLHATSAKLARGFLAKLVFRNKEEVADAVSAVLGSEAGTAAAIQRMISDISALASLAKTDPAQVIEALSRAIKALEEERLKYLDLELRVRRLAD